ncbi:hypothetical protein IMCC9480_2919 [Oxalobacteraceae bacterium IMCC9480]|nr:hypothetical protein IMCC9480_2919 [Oxalobacteraceae bacterium IMCC9480]
MSVARGFFPGQPTFCVDFLKMTITLIGRTRRSAGNSGFA